MRPEYPRWLAVAVLLAAGSCATASAQDVLRPGPGDSTLSGSPAAPRATPAPEPQRSPDLPPQSTTSPDTAAPPDTSDQPPKPAYAPTPAPTPPTWQPRQTAVLQALDKLDGQAATLTVPVGQTQNWRKMSITVRSCFARPPDQPQDATAFLVIAGGLDTPGFAGWMLAAEPAASMMQHPVYDVRVLGCR